MFSRPEMYCLIARDNGEVAPLISQEKLQVMMDGVITIVIGFILFYVFWIISDYWSITHWTKITHWIEISLIIVGLSILTLGKFIADELTTKLVKKFEALKEQNAAKDKLIDEKDKLIDEKDKLIDEIKKVRNINNKEDVNVTKCNTLYM